MHNRCTPRQRRVLALRMQHNALKCAKMRSRSTKMRCEMHELNAPLWTECRQNAKKNAENAQKCTSQKRYQFVAKTVLIPRSTRSGFFLVLSPSYNSTRNPTHSPLGRVRSAIVRAPASVSSLLSQPDIRLSGRPLASRTTDFMPLMLHDPVASISSSCPARPESEPRSSCKARLPT